MWPNRCGPHGNAETGENGSFVILGDATTVWVLKILHLATVASSHRYLLLPQLVALADDGHDVLAVSAPGDDVEELRRNGIRHRSLDGSTRGMDLRADLRALRSFARIVRDERPDVVHTHNPKPGLYGRIVSRLLRTPHVVNTVHGLYALPEDPFRKRAVVYGLEAIASRFSHLEFVQSVEDVELMSRSRIASSSKLVHLGNGIDVRRFTPQQPAEERLRIRKSLGIASDACVVVSIGRLVAEKGFAELFEASRRTDAPHELVVVGPVDPEKQDSLTEQQLDSARSDGVHILGHRSDLHQLLPACDLFVLASYREGVPRAAMEAAACGLPLIVTDIRGCRQVVDDGVNGMLVPRADVGPLADALGVMITDRQLRGRAGAASREKALAEFDERLVIERLFDGYRRIGALETI